MTARWQILICTLANPTRRAFLTRLMGVFEPQLTDGVEVLTVSDNGEASIGAKRQQAIEQATAEWVSFVDDDDLVSPHYVSRISSVIFGDDPPDVVGFKLAYFADGVRRGTAIHSYEAPTVVLPPRPSRHARFNRLPNHLNPVRRELALKVGYKPLDFGEDSDYSRRLAALKPREHYIDAELYSYLYRRQRPGEVTHMTRCADEHALKIAVTA